MNKELDKFIEVYIFDTLNHSFIGKYSFNMGINGEIVVDGIIIKGISFMPSDKSYFGVKEHVEKMVELIWEEIGEGTFLWSKK